MKQLGKLLLSGLLCISNPVFASSDGATRPSSPCPSTIDDIFDSGNERLIARANKYFRDGKLGSLTKKEACAELEEMFQAATEAGTCPNGRCGTDVPSNDVNITREETREWVAQSKGGFFSNSNLMWGLGGALLGGVVGYMAGKNNWFGSNNNDYWGGGWNQGPWPGGGWNQGGPAWRPGWWGNQRPPGVVPMPWPGMGGGIGGWPGMGGGIGGWPGMGGGIGGWPGMGGGIGGWPGMGGGIGGWPGMGGGLSGGAPIYIPGVGYAGGSPIYNGGGAGYGGGWGGGYGGGYGGYYNTPPPIVGPMGVTGTR